MAPPAARERSGMNRSESEWAFQEFLREHDTGGEAEDGEERTGSAAVQRQQQQQQQQQQQKRCLPALDCVIEEANGVEAEFDERQEVRGALNPLFSNLHSDRQGFGNLHHPHDENYLKKRLELACAAVALTRDSGNRVGKSTPLGIPALPPKPEAGSEPRKPAVTSGSSRDHSEDDEADADLSTVEQGGDVSDVKRMRRMLSNRESARRSRRRKQAHMSDLETQVAQLRVENSSLLKQLNEINKKFSDAAVDNRVLKSDVEALRAKVKMAEDAVSRAGSNGFSRPRSHQKPPFHSENSQAPHSDHQKHLKQQAGGNKMNRTPSMQRVASLEHLQKRIRGPPLSCNTNNSDTFSETPETEEP